MVFPLTEKKYANIGLGVCHICTSFQHPLPLPLADNLTPAHTRAKAIMFNSVESHQVECDNAHAFLRTMCRDLISLSFTHALAHTHIRARVHAHAIRIELKRARVYVQMCRCLLVRNAPLTISRGGAGWECRLMGGARDDG